MELQALIQERIREESDRGVGTLSTQFPEQRELNSETAHHRMSELELSTETNVDNLPEWAEKLREEKKILKLLIKDYLPKRKILDYRDRLGAIKLKEHYWAELLNPIPDIKFKSISGFLLK
ncbi:hypothetical protein Droror1_Dr00028332 [Drosera rotundifolia]